MPSRALRAGHRYPHPIALSSASATPRGSRIRTAYPSGVARMRYLASDRTTRAVGLVATLREVATHFALDGSEGVAAELRRIADNHEREAVR